MDRRRGGYKLEHSAKKAEDEFFSVSYDDKDRYFPAAFLQGPGVRNPSAYGGPFVNGDSQSRNDSSIESGRRSRKRKFLCIAVLVTAVLVVLAIVTAVVTATLTGSTEKESGSRTVERKVQKVYEGQVTMASELWSDALTDKNSTEYKTMEADFIAKMDENFRQSDLAENYDRTIVKGFQKGSVQTFFDVVFTFIIQVQVTEDAASTTPHAPGNDPGSDVNIGTDIDTGFEASFVLSVVAEIKDFTGAVVSDVNECDSNPCSNGGTCTDDVNKFTCTCIPGFTGQTCDEDIDECESSPCQYGGICSDQINGYTCTCVTGIEGDNCEINIDDCDPNQCQNTGQCIDGIDEYRCNCTSGFTGDNCETEINECSSSPCQNDGKCNDDINSYTCECEPGYTGNNCETDVNECASNPYPCQNNGTCHDGTNMYTCDCKPGYTGAFCETDVNDCEANPCKNEGSCTDDVNDYTCTCKAGWTGKNCDTNINECEPDPCENGGTCIDAIDDYNCTCEPGWTGKICDTNIDDCLQIICENGVCVDGVNDFSCICDDGWTGGFCDEDVDECVVPDDPCKNLATCQNTKGSFLCICSPGWAGSSCDININECALTEDLCSNGATCVDNEGSYTCSCLDGWEGPTCELNINECALTEDLCSNGATCVDNEGSYTCSCLDGWEGPTCELNINECALAEEVCSNGATCVDNEGSYSCSCLDGWEGPTCELNIDECSLETNPCKNGGICEDNYGGYTCKCLEGWEGPTCETIITTTSTKSTTMPEKVTSSESTQVSTQDNRTSTRRTTTPLTTTMPEKVTSTNSTQVSTQVNQNTSERFTTNLTTISWATTCASGDVPCFENNTCIPFTWLCDGVADCQNGSDELNCSTPATTPSSNTTTTKAASSTTIASPCRNDQFYCFGRCHPNSYLCDNYEDCIDGSDEVGCDCPEGRCLNGHCFSFSNQCDGYNDCSDGTDEKGCPLVCSDDQFLCKREEQCVNNSKLCDGIKDCFDGTDEWYTCTNKTTPMPYPLELEVRLMDGNNETTDQLYGRVEVRRLINGEPVSEFGTICDDSWDSREAVVVCRSLNSSNEWQSFAYGGAVFGEGSGPIWFRNFHCEGNEDKLEDCSSAGFGRTHCSHNRDAAVSCGIDLLSTMSTSTMSSSSSSGVSSTTSPILTGRNIRLVDGNNCLEGRIEIFHMGAWVTVCDAYFSYYEARAVCQTLGSRYLSYYGLYFGSGSGSIYHLDCSYYSNTINDCTLSPTSLCGHDEDQGIRCYGDPDEVCTVDPGVPSTNCSFNEDICAYNMTTISGDDSWSWKKASLAGITDSENIPDGRVMLYSNTAGSELDSSQIESPSFSPTTDNMKVEFDYQLQESSYSNLIFSIKEKREGEEDRVNEMWNSIYLSRDLEYKWLYECISLTNLSQLSNYTLLFTAVRGAYTTTVTALDNIRVTNGLCAESLLDTMCDFERLSLCGMTVECSACDRRKMDYRWMWQNGTNTNQITSDGYFVMASSAFGTEGEETVMSFAVPRLGNKTVLKYTYYMFGENGGSLEVHLYEGEVWHSRLHHLSGDYGNWWFPQCLKLPSNIDDNSRLKIKFKATCGKSSYTAIGIDNVQLDYGDCPNSVECFEHLPQCGWITNENSGLEWQFFRETEAKIIRLVDGPNPSRGTVEIFHDGEWGRVCDDYFGTPEAKVICRMLGYPADRVSYMRYSYYGGYNPRIWLDDLFCDGTEETLYDCRHNGWGVVDCSAREYASVVCYGEIKVTVPVSPSFEKNFFKITDTEGDVGSWASVSSREFDHDGGDSRFMFDYQKGAEGILQVWLKDITTKQSQILGKIIEATEFEHYCVELPSNITGKVKAGITAFKLSNETIMAVIQNFELNTGSCKESLAMRMFTFETDHRLYGYTTVSPSSLEDRCGSWHGWTRVTASTAHFMESDHTYQNETGHFMYSYGSPSYSELRLRHISAEESTNFCSLRFFYFTSGDISDDGLFVSINDLTKALTGLPKVSIWLQGCVMLADRCGDPPGSLNISFKVAGVKAGIDDIELSSIPCSDLKNSSVSCEFWKGDTCDYYMEETWNFNNDGNLTTSAEAPGNFLVSQPFEIITNSCIVLAFGCPRNYSVQMMTVSINGEIVATTGRLDVEYSSQRNLYLDVKPGSNLRLYFDAYQKQSTYLQQGLEVYFINVTDFPCDHSGLSCNKNDFECGELCVPNYEVCNGERQCEDGSDEKCGCDLNSFNCTLFDECIHPSLQCDGFNDCSDGSDESNCGPSINCTFNFWTGSCGYKLHNAYVWRNHMLWMGNRLAYISSPEVLIKTESCLVINFTFSYPVNIRVSSDNSEMYSILYQGSIRGATMLSIDVGIGHHGGFVIEAQSTRQFGYFDAYIDKITLFETPCQELLEKYETTTKQKGWTEYTDTTITLPWFTWIPSNTSTTSTGWPTWMPTSTDSTTTRWPTWKSTTKDSTTTPWTTQMPSTRNKTTTGMPTWMTAAMNLTTPGWFTWIYDTNHSTTNAWLESSYRTTTTASAMPIPDDFPKIEVDGPKNGTFGGSVSLSCKTTIDEKYELIMFWTFSNGSTISREDDIMIGDNDQSKYFIQKSQRNGQTIYNLTVYDLTEADATTYYCVADVVGYQPWTWPRDGTLIQIEDDGCIGIGSMFISEVCNSAGYNRVTVPSVSGIQTVYQFHEAIKTLQDKYDTFKSYNPSYESQCFTPLLKLACGLHISHCEAGKVVRPVCREHCHEIADVCMNDPFNIVSSVNTDINHYCKYLSSEEDRSDCTEIWLGCGVEIMLGRENTTMSVRLRSENFPHGPPSISECNYVINASLYYLLNVTISDIILPDNCSTNYLKVNGKKICSSNASLVEQMSLDGTFDITLTSYNSEQNTGFLLNVTQVLPPGICDIIEVSSRLYKKYNGSNTKNNLCSEWRFHTTRGYSIEIQLNAIDGCLEILDEDLNFIQEVCDLTKDLVVNGYGVVIIKSSDNFELSYRLQTSSSSRYNFGIGKVELRGGESVSEGYVFVSRTDGLSGYICGYINNGAADVICRMAGFGSSALTTTVISDDSAEEEILLYDLHCYGNEDSLVQCYSQEWIDICDYCYCYWRGIFSVSCSVKTVSCNMSSPDGCGYEYNSSVVISDSTSRFGDGLYMVGSEAQNTQILSPSFSYSGRDNIAFEYSFDGGYDDDIEVYVKRMNESETAVSVWKKAHYNLDGLFRACVNLPDVFINEEVQLMFKLSMISSGRNHTIGLHNVSLTSESCPELFPVGTCSFDSVEVCDSIFSQICFDDITGGNVWTIKDSILMGDTSYAQDNIEYPITFSVATTLGSYIHFMYSQTGTGINKNDLKLMVKTESISDGAEIIYSDSEFRKDMKRVCLQLPSTEDDTLDISFILSKINSEGIIFVDDVGINDHCPSPVSCSFEGNIDCSYIIPSNNVFQWKQTYVFGDHTSGGNGYGYVVQAQHLNSADVGLTAVFKTPVTNISRDLQYRCLSFFYKKQYFSPTDYELKVEILYTDLNETKSFEIETFVPNEWQEANVFIDPSKSISAQFSFLVRNLYGRVFAPIEIDDVKLLAEKCTDGLQDLKQCDFNNAGLCGFRANCTVGSGYIWQVQQWSRATGPSMDADGVTTGYFLQLDSSLGDSGHESFVWFRVDLKGRTNQQYKFSYFFSGNGTAKLETFHRNAITNEYSEKLSVENIYEDKWIDSYCYELPDHFQGEIYFYAVRGDSAFSDIAIDNVRTMDGNCQDPSVSCDFLDNKCGYMPEDSHWILEEGSITISSGGILNIPTYTLKEDSCIQFEFESYVNEVLKVITDTESGPLEHNYVAYTEGKTVGQVLYSTHDKGIRFLVPGTHSVRIDLVTAVAGNCSPIACSEDEMACPQQCIPQTAVCDRKWDCNNGIDENGCGFSIPCEFKNLSDCGYSTIPGSPTEWTVLETYTFQHNDIESTVTGGMLFTSFEDYPTRRNTSASSTWHSIEETKCLRFRYLGTIQLITVTVLDKEDDTEMQWSDRYADMTPYQWRPSQMTVNPGTISVTFTASYNISQTYQETPFVAIDNIELLSGACETHQPPACPDEASFQCENGSLCYKQEITCDKTEHCYYGEDESFDTCGPKSMIACDFEDHYLCGWTILNAVTPWEVSEGYQYQIPPYDHTTQNESGHFLHSVNWDNNHNIYEQATVTSPIQTFQEDGCITFWYYLNSTNIQPSALSAQILVSLIYKDTSKTEFLWFDYVDRPIYTWLQGGVPVRGNAQVQMNVTSIQFETYRAWPGVVALDDVEYSPGECEVKQECHERAFECKDSRVCIPEEFICDGKSDCVDASDEADCNSRPDGTMSLAGGDGTYGQLRYFKDGSWRPICSPSEATESYLTQWVCEELGYTGNSAWFNYTLLSTATQPVSLNCVTGSCSEATCYSYYGTRYVGIKCSNTACFSGEKRCPGTDSVTCVPKGRFCDGLPDCPDNMDEKQCYCTKEEGRCTRTPDECVGKTCETCSDRDMFECQDHQCIDQQKRCDGKKDCSDGFDEYRCVQINDIQVLLNNGSKLLPVCYNNIGRDEADLLCSLAGKGLVTNDGILHGYTQIENGIVMTETHSLETFIPGLQKVFVTSCYPLILHCQLPECGTAAYMDSQISPVIIHGNKAVPGEWPFQGILRRNGRLSCGCSLIGGRWALTAAHCVDDWYYGTSGTVLFGSTHSGSSGPHGQEISVADFYIHPSYTEGDITNGYDLAVLKLAYAPNVDNYTRPVCLGSEKDWRYILELGDKAECYITGFGADELYIAQGINQDKDLAETKVDIVDREKCKEIWYSYTETQDNVAKDGICLENSDPHQPACYGDSGGPFVCKNRIGRWVQLGVTSYGSRSCSYFVPAIYNNLTVHMDWIQSKTGINYATSLGDSP